MTEQMQLIRRETDVYLAVSYGRKLAREIGFDEVDRTKIEIAILELTRNILVHAQEGHVILRITQQDEQRGIEVEARDDGPGIADVDLALRDGFSTAATLGCGLPGVKRLMDDFVVETQLGVGTTVRAVRWLPAQTKRKRLL